MRDQSRISAAEAEEALANPAVLSEAAAARAGGAFADWLMDRGGEDRFLKLLEGADVDIETTFDPRIQRIAEDALADVFDRKVKEGIEGPGCHRRDALRRLGRCHGRRARKGCGPVQPGDPGDAPTRQRLQAGGLCRRVGGRGLAIRHSRGPPADHQRLVAEELRQQLFAGPSR